MVLNLGTSKERRTPRAIHEGPFRCLFIVGGPLEVGCYPNGLDE